MLIPNNMFESLILLLLYHDIIVCYVFTKNRCAEIAKYILQNMKRVQEEECRMKLNPLMVYIMKRFAVPEIWYFCRVF
jgi:hypothetical protein